MIFRIKYNFLTLFHWTRKSSLKILPQDFLSKSETSHLYENFQRVVSSQKFHWTGKKHFWQAPRKLFSLKVTLRHRSKSGKKEWYLKFPSESFFPICSSVHIEFSSENFAGSISQKLSQKFCSKSENENKRLIFQKKAAENVLWTRRLQFWTLPEVIHPKWKKRSFQTSVRLQHVPLDVWEADVTTLPILFAQSPNLVKTWKIFHSNYFVLKIFHWRWWMLTWQS